MARDRTRLPHDLPDRAVGEAVVHPDNLRAVLREVAPAVADRLDYDRLEVVKRLYFLDDWRRRDNDILVRLPFLDGSRHLLVCILLEHQSTADDAMPLRLLVYAVLFWESEWQAWQASHEHGVPLRLTPVLPVVLYTGSEPWDANRALAELFDAPAELQAWLPSWTMPLWDVQAHPVEQLLQSPEAFWQAMAVVRADRTPTDEFLATLRQALERIQSRGKAAPVHWDQLVRLVLSWSLYRRPRREHDRLREAARNSHADVALQRRIEQMSQQVEKGWGEELLEQFLERERKVVADAVADTEVKATVKALRSMLRRQLEGRFQTLSPELLQRLESASVEQLQAAIDQVITVPSPNDLQW